MHSDGIVIARSEATWRSRAAAPAHARNDDPGSTQTHHALVMPNMRPRNGARDVCMRHGAARVGRVGFLSSVAGDPGRRVDARKGSRSQSRRLDPVAGGPAAWTGRTRPGRTGRRVGAGANAGLGRRRVSAAAARCRGGGPAGRESLPGGAERQNCNERCAPPATISATSQRSQPALCRGLNGMASEPPRRRSGVFGQSRAQRVGHRRRSQRRRGFTKD
jgi:hypothetical protein